MPNPAHPATAVIAEVVDKYGDELVALRRDLHAHPELSWNEDRTSEQVADRARGRPAGRHPARGRRACSPTRHRRPARRAARRPRRAARRRPDGRPVGQHRARRRPRLRPRRPHRRPGRRRPRAGRGRGRGLLPGRVRLLFQPAEEVMPGGALHLIVRRRARRRRPHLRPALRPQPRRGQHRPARGPAHRRCRRADGQAHRQGRPHLAPAPDRGPHLRPRQGHHRAARDPRRRLDPRAGVSVVWGIVRAGSAHNVIPHSGGSPARSGCSTPSPGPRPSTSSAS